MITVAANSFLVLFLMQLCCVAAVSLTLRRGVPARLNILLSSAFVTVPVWTYPPLADVGMVFLFDLVVPILMLRELYFRDFVVRVKPVAIVGVLVFLIPVFFAPTGYFFIDPFYIGYHTLILASVLYRSLLIFIAAIILADELRSVDQSAVARIMAFQFLVLFSLGALQYLAGIDFVVYERLKDVGNVVDGLLSGRETILFGFGFLGLFRGAIPQMAVIGIFWWLLVNLRKYSGKIESYLLIAMCLLAIICVAGSLSRIGILAIVCVLLYAAFVNRHLRLWSVFVLLAGLPVLFFSSYLDILQGIWFEMIVGRFDVEQFSGQLGSGETRIESAVNLFEAMQESWLPWVVGLGGFNPIAANEYYGVFGMHGDYLDVIARYGLLVGLSYVGLVIILFVRLLDGFFSHDPIRREIPRAFGALVIGIGILALTQGALTFSGSAGYLASAQTWLAIAFCIVMCMNLGRVSE